MARHSGVVPIAAGLIVLAASACAHVPVADQSSAPNVITADQIATTQATNAYEAVQKLQPNFLVTRGPTSLLGTSSATPNVYLDDVRYGSMPSLRQIPAQSIATIRMYRAWEATTKFGTGNMGGVIEVVTKH